VASQALAVFGPEFIWQSNKSLTSLDTTNVIPFDAEISHLVILMSLTYVFGIYAGNRKYQ